LGFLPKWLLKYKDLYKKYNFLRMFSVYQHLHIIKKENIKDAINR
jgi:hypothetical protein